MRLSLRQSIEIDGANGEVWATVMVLRKGFYPSPGFGIHPKQLEHGITYELRARRGVVTLNGSDGSTVKCEYEAFSEEDVQDLYRRARRLHAGRSRGSSEPIE